MAGGLGEIYGSKPVVPQWQAITLGGQQQNAIANNVGSLPSNESLAMGVNSFNQSQLTSMLNSIMPGWSQTANTMTQNINQELQGKLPGDVQSEIQNSSAAQAMNLGVAGSGFGSNLTAESLGLSSLQLQQTGMSEEQNWTNQVDQLFAPGMFNVSSMFVNPQQEFQDTFQNQEMSWGQQWLSNQVSAMPKPQAAGLESYLSGLGSSLMSAI